MTDASEFDPARTTQAPAVLVERWIKNAEFNVTLLQMRLANNGSVVQSLKTQIQVWEDRIERMRKQQKPNLWADDIEAQLVVPPPIPSIDNSPAVQA